MADGRAPAPARRDRGRSQGRAWRGRALAARIGTADKFWFGLAPEGTRKPVERWKSGFWKIAKAADVPVLPAYFHYPDKVIGIGPLFDLADDMAADIARLRAWYRLGAAATATSRSRLGWPDTRRAASRRTRRRPVRC